MRADRSKRSVEPLGMLPGARPSSVTARLRSEAKRLITSGLTVLELSVVFGHVLSVKLRTDANSRKGESDKSE